ncbi:2'-5' RNA ligase family protein [Actinoplanes sp. GCM10030250]|uniref:2'-5' RNA ligase family protein n=1 Tax=Actinoplanes sp. GCM10030250 TaxID=3273376 RepID=UPI003617D647
MEPTSSALVVLIPEAEPAVAALRSRLDRAAAWGMPAHVTVLYPFLPPQELTPPVLAAVRNVTAGLPPFFLTLDRVGWFGERVLWLSPEPAEPFRELTHRLAARFPRARPYNGEFADVVPHLTVGRDHPPADLRAAATEAEQHLPIHAWVSTVQLLVGRAEPGGSWTTVADFPLT